MLNANSGAKGTILNAFHASLNEKDRNNLNAELDKYGKELLSTMLIMSSYEELFELLQDREISPLLFQWSLAVRDGVAGSQLIEVD